MAHAALDHPTPTVPSAIPIAARAVASSHTSALPSPERSTAAMAWVLVAPPEANTTLGTLRKASSGRAMARRLIGWSMG